MLLGVKLAVAHGKYLGLPSLIGRISSSGNSFDGGLFSVKSGYYQALESNVNPYASSSRLSGDIWKKIWQIKMIPNCKNFLWRACKNVFPVPKNLKRRVLMFDDMYPRCGKCVETVSHAILLSEEVKHIWFASVLGDIISVPEDSLFSKFADCLRLGDLDMLARVSELARTIWKISKVILMLLSWMGKFAWFGQKNPKALAWLFSLLRGKPKGRSFLAWFDSSLLGLAEK
ncbi:hypothetical protein JHK82_049473 [Glycine max]|nr:hypothetical protein JHK85_050096 [Glycine max]KAG5090695.1 hypothetical protein JHK82_049473 [Glycine max]KAG5093783.1 hypothetical protein JHK84_049371 [Glycine max]